MATGWRHNCGENCNTFDNFELTVELSNFDNKAKTTELDNKASPSGKVEIGNLTFHLTSLLTSVTSSKPLHKLQHVLH